MTTDQKLSLLSDLMDIREKLADLQARVGVLTAELAESEYADNHPTKVLTLTHATEPMPNASLKDEPPSSPLPPAA